METSTGSADLICELMLINGGTSYTGSGALAQTISGLGLGYARSDIFQAADVDGVLDAAPLVGSSRALLWGLPDYASAFETPGTNFAARADEQGWVDAMGWGHAYFPDFANVNDPDLDLIFHDATASLSALDISNIYIGPVWQPSQNVRSIAVNPAAQAPGVARTIGGQEYRAEVRAPREWTVDLWYQHYSDAEADWFDMSAKVGLHGPVLVIEDPDNPSQKGTIYGTVTGYSEVREKWFQDRGDGTSGLRPHCGFTVRELLK